MSGLHIPALDRRLLRGGVAIALTLTATFSITDSAQAAPVRAAHSTSWTISFGSIGPISTKMTVARAIDTLHSHVSSKPGDPYCGLFGLTKTGSLTGYAPQKGGNLQMLSIGSLFGPSRAGLPKVVQTSKGVRLGTSLARLKAAYPHRLRETRSYGNKLETLEGSRGLAISFEIARGAVSNIATGNATVLSQGEYCG